jgi:hypothetical protein
MKLTIPKHIHENLSASERVRAAISAIARGDEYEIQILKETCPKLSVMMSDPAYSEKLKKLFNLALAVESDLQMATLSFLMSSHLEEHELTVQASYSARATEAAWSAFLEEMGIPSGDMTKAGPPRHQAVKSLLKSRQGDEISPEIIRPLIQSFRNHLDA